MDNMELRRIFSVNLKKIRNSQNLTQEKLAEMVDLSVQTIADIESCRTWISDKTLVKLVNSLYISPAQLFIETKDIDLLDLKDSLKKDILSQIDMAFQKIL